MNAQKATFEQRSMCHDLVKYKQYRKPPHWVAAGLMMGACL